MHQTLSANIGHPLVLRHGFQHSQSRSCFFFFLRKQTSEATDFGNAKSQVAKKALLAGYVTISKELCQFNSTLTITERRVRFKNRTMFEGIISVSYFTERWLPEGRTVRHDQTILRQCIVYLKYKCNICIKLSFTEEKLWWEVFWLNNRELKQLRRRPQRRLQKNNSFSD